MKGAIIKMTYKEIREKIELAKEYQKEIDTITQQYQLEEKEKFVKDCEKLQQDPVFIKHFVDKFEELFELVNNLKANDEFCNFLFKNGMEPDNIYEYHYDLTFRKGTGYFYICYDYEDGWGEKCSQSICYVPFHIDLCEVLTKMEDYSKELEERKQVKDALEKKESIRQKYNLYLQLKKEFEDVESIEDLEELEER